MDPTTPLRRRGKALDDALLQAVWEELQERGYAALTFDGVARRAGTSRPVLYRRWETKADLVRAAITHHTRAETVAVPDTGTVRGDVVAVLVDFNRRRADAIALLTVGLGSYFEETGTSLGDMREAVVSGRTDVMEAVLERAAARGEIDPDRVTPRIRRLPGDLLRSEMMLTLQPVRRKVIEEIVDTIFLPLISR